MTPLDERRLPLRGPLVSQLCHALDRCVDAGSPRVVCVVGEAGSGKTTLLHELRTVLQARTDQPVVGYGRAHGAISANARQPFRDAMRDLEEGLAETSSEPRGRRFKAILRASAPSWLGVIPVFGSVISAVATTVDAAAASARDEATDLPDSLTYQFCRALEGLGEEAPVVLLLDDLHWLDEESGELLFAVTQRVQAPVLLVLSFRPDAGLDGTGAHPTRGVLDRVGRYTEYDEVQLDALDTPAVRELAALRLSGEPDEELVRWLCAHSGGNALFVVSLADYLEDLGSLVRHHGVISLDRGGSSLSDVPRTLGSVLREQMGGLSQADRCFLDAASVLGARFVASEAARVAATGETKHVTLSRLGARGRGLLSPVPGGDDVYRFSQPLLQELIVTDLLQHDPSVYADLHRRAATVLEDRADLEDVDWLSASARHWHEAGDHVNAYLSSMLCASAMTAVGAPSSAAHFAGWAVEHADELGSLDDRVDARIARGEALLATLRPSECVACWDELEDLLVPELSPGRQVNALIFGSAASSVARAPDRCRSALRRAMELEQSVEPDRRAEMRVLLAGSHLFGDELDPAAAMDLIVAAAPLARSPLISASVERHRALAALGLGDVESARRAGPVACGHARDSQDAWAVFQSSLFAAYVSVALLELSAVSERLDELEGFAERHSIAPMDLHRLRGRVASLSGDWPRAADAWWRFLEIDLALGRTDRPTRDWALTHFLLSIEETAIVRGSAAALELLTALESKLRADADRVAQIDATLPRRVEVLAHAFREGGPLIGALGAAGLDHATDASASRVHHLFTGDIHAFRQRSVRS